MNGKFFADKSLGVLFDPGEPFLYILVVAPGILIALGRVRLAVSWLGFAIAGMVFLSYVP